MKLDGKQVMHGAMVPMEMLFPLSGLGMLDVAMLEPVVNLVVRTLF